MASGQLRLIETAGHFKGLEPFVKRFKAAGAFVIHKCVAVRHAKSAERLGVDMISMDGFDCAGHPGEEDIGNWVLFPKVRIFSFRVEEGNVLKSRRQENSRYLLLQAEAVEMGNNLQQPSPWGQRG